MAICGATRSRETVNVTLERRPDTKVARANWETFLRESFEKNKPYDVLAKELLSGDGVEPNSRPLAKFFLERDFETPEAA